MARSNLVLVGFLLLLPSVPAFADEPRHAVSLGAGAANVRNTGVAAPELGVGLRFRPRGWWYARVARGDYGFWSIAAPLKSDGGAFEVRTGPIWQRCWTAGCHGIGLELGWQRTYGTFSDGATMPPEWSEVTHSVVFDTRWRGELHLYGDGLVALEASAGLRIQRGVHYASDPVASWASSVTGTQKGGLAASLALIVRR